MRIPSIPGFDQQALEKYFKNTGWLLIGRVGSMLVKFVIKACFCHAICQAEEFGNIKLHLWLLLLFL
jgi:hypothetical protein